VEKREQRLMLAEEEAEMRNRNAAAALEQRRTELQEARKRIREEAAHSTMMAERSKADMGQQLVAAQARLKESEERCGRLEVEMQKLKQVQRGTNESQLMVEVASARAAAEEVRGRLRVSEEACDRYKEQLAKALKQILRMREEEHEREIEQVRLTMFAKSEGEYLDGQRATISDLRRHIQTLKAGGAVSYEAQQQPMGWNTQYLAGYEPVDASVPAGAGGVHAPASGGGGGGGGLEMVGEEEEEEDDEGGARDVSVRGDDEDGTETEEVMRLRDEKEALLRTVRLPI
jgi:hypothetical protein